MGEEGGGGGRGDLLGPKIISNNYKFKISTQIV